VLRVNIKQFFQYGTPQTCPSDIASGELTRFEPARRKQQQKFP
jgi:hypothetical protein